jgi:hypothetical protein
VRRRVNYIVPEVDFIDTITKSYRPLLAVHSSIGCTSFVGSRTPCLAVNLLIVIDFICHLLTVIHPPTCCFRTCQLLTITTPLPSSQRMKMRPRKNVILMFRSQSLMLFWVTMVSDLLLYFLRTNNRLLDHKAAESAKTVFLSCNSLWEIQYLPCQNLTISIGIVHDPDGYA